MKIVKGYQSLDQPPVRSAVTIGNFDGVHLGHRAIVQTAIAQARARGGTAIAYTFRPHPQLALHPERAQALALLSTYDEKLQLLGSLGLDLIVEEPFNPVFSSMTPDRFFAEVLVGALRAESVVVGYDFGFGKSRAGGITALREFCDKAGVALTVIPPQDSGGSVISSSRIRRALESGELAAANQWLGREFSYSGKVEHGEARGRRLGFPTANLRPDKLVLPFGVYATWAICQEKRFPSVTNLGVRPTFVDPAAAVPPVLVETYLIDESLDLYGQALEVRFVKRLRAEEKFAGIDELKAQIARDVGDARVALESATRV